MAGVIRTGMIHGRRDSSSIMSGMMLQSDWDMNMTIPSTPEVGLFLVKSLFPAYNDKWQLIHGELSMKGLEKQISKFKHKHIYSYIASTEVKEGTVGMWLHSLNQRNYVDFAVAWEEERAKEKVELL